MTSTLPAMAPLGRAAQQYGKQQVPYREDDDDDDEYDSYEEEEEESEGSQERVKRAASYGSPPTPETPRNSLPDASFSSAPMVTPSPSSSSGNNQLNSRPADGEDALLDLAQLEELQHEAERMKALGNKHMAAQEYTKAYNAYSAALQLSPVGPSSHVFLSNRAAALLSLKRYSAAAVDARRAIALAPSFGKAHARLGQSLYFMKEFAGAVAAYTDAMEYEPDNAVTRTYLEKAKNKLAKQKARDDAVSYSADSQQTIINSVVTDPQARDAVVKTGFRGSSAALQNAIAASAKKPAPADNASDDEDEDDPDFEEALRLQQRANRYLSRKQYKSAIEEYSAALFLVPDDPVLSPELHLGRAHALNGSRRHASARNDAQMAIRLAPTSPEAYSTLAKSLFYMKEYEEAIEAFTKCKHHLGEDRDLSTFDHAYLEKAERAISEDGNETRSSRSSSGSIPKLPPPRFVPREKAITTAPKMPPMPKQWPQQMHAAEPLRCGPERVVVFFSESLGVKLNRGTDGVVRVLWVAPETQGSPIVRKGTIQPGDVVREAVGVDLRRPLTNVMWGDTVALIKMAPRPIGLVVAQELSDVPASVKLERERVVQDKPHFVAVSPAQEALQRGESKQELDDSMEVFRILPSYASGDEPVGESMARKQGSPAESEPVSSAGDEEASSQAPPESVPDDTADEGEKKAGASQTEEQTIKDDDEQPQADDEKQSAADQDTTLVTDKKHEDSDENASKEAVLDAKNSSESTEADTSKEPMSAGAAGEKQHAAEQTDTSTTAFSSSQSEESLDIGVVISQRDAEMAAIGGEVLFPRTKLHGWDNLRWMSYSGARKVRCCEPVRRRVVKKGLIFWSGEDYVERTLAIYDEPQVMLILRKPKSTGEVAELLCLPDDAEFKETGMVEDSFWVVENCMEAQTCKLVLSKLTNVTSVINQTASEDDTPRSRSCFELVTPSETIALSAVRPRHAKKLENSYSDSGAFMETSKVELAIADWLCNAHTFDHDDMAWRHQRVLGTLHSVVVSGNQKLLEEALDEAAKDHKEEDGLPHRAVNAVDSRGRTPLYYACVRANSTAVTLLVSAGAKVDFSIGPHAQTPCHVCASNLDETSLSSILSHPSRPDPNALDALGRTPMYVAATEGCTIQKERDSVGLERCMVALEAWGGTLLSELSTLWHPASVVASQWRAQELEVLLNHMHYRYPFVSRDKLREGMSLGARFHYPLHSALIALRNELRCMKAGKESKRFGMANMAPESLLFRTVRVLLQHGFEPNERLEGIVDEFEEAAGFAEYVGYAPLQILAAAAQEMAGLEAQENMVNYIEAVVADIAEFLVQNGARLSLESPPASRGSRSSSSRSLKEADRSDLRIESNKEVLQALGGLPRLNAAKKMWLDVKPISTTPRLILERSASSAEDSEAPGGSDEKSCAICWKTFGALRNRRHKCRVTLRYVCDECSSKRVVANQEYRLSDGQFSLARVDAIQKEEREKERAREVESDKFAKSVEAVRAKRLEDEANRDSLFGGMMKNASNIFGGKKDDEEEEASPGEQLKGLTDKLEDTRNALNERGEKLNTLNEKTSNLVNASRDFAKMARELKESQSRGLFW